MIAPLFKTRVVAVALVSLSILTFGSVALAQSEDATAFRTNPAHTAQQTMPDFVAPIGVTWDVNLGSTVGYPVIAEGKVFDIIHSPQAYEGSLVALNVKDGSVAWSVDSLPGTAWYSATTTASGSVTVAGS